MSIAIDQKLKKKSKIPYIFVAFFGVVLAVNVVFVTFALSTWTGLETENPYIKGINYNESLKAAAEQQARGWVSKMDWKLLETQKVGFTINLKDKEGAVITGADFRLLLLRPTTTGYDSETTLLETSNGQYEGIVTFPLPGIWDIKQVIEHTDGTYQSVERINLSK